MSKTSNLIKENLAQFVLIVFSVVLGLYLSERIEDSKNQRESDNMLTIIKSEVNDNIALLEYWAPYHQEILVKLDSLAGSESFLEAFINDKTILFSQLLSRGTFMARFPANDAWEIAKSHPLIVNVDYHQLLALSQLYRQQEITFEPGIEMIDLLQAPNLNNREDASANIASIMRYMHELVAREQQLLEYYHTAEDVFGLKEDSSSDL